MPPSPQVLRLADQVAGLLLWLHQVCTMRENETPPRLVGMKFYVMVSKTNKVVTLIEDSGSQQVIVLSPTDAYRLGEALRDKADEVMDDTTGYLMDNELTIERGQSYSGPWPQFVKPWMVWPRGDECC